MPTGRGDSTVELWANGARVSASNPLPIAGAAGGTAATVDVTDRAGRVVGVVTLDAATLSALESITAVGPVTNTELRASPVPVSGTVTAATGGLTDAQLRASGVPVTEASLDALIKAEDVASASGDRGVPVLAARNDGGASLVDTDGDYGMLQLDNAGRLRVVTAASYLEDAASVDGDRGIFVLAMRHDADSATVGTDGDYSALQTNVNGRLKVSAAPSIGTLVDRSGALTTGGTAQALAAANSTRKYLFVFNPPDAAGQGIATAEALYIDFTTTAVIGSPSIRLDPGAVFVMESGFVSTEAISVKAATTTHKWTAKESA